MAGVPRLLWVSPVSERHSMVLAPSEKQKHRIRECLRCVAQRSADVCICHGNSCPTNLPRGLWWCSAIGVPLLFGEGISGKKERSSDVNTAWVSVFKLEAHTCVLGHFLENTYY